MICTLGLSHRLHALDLDVTEGYLSLNFRILSVCHDTMIISPSTNMHAHTHSLVLQR